MLMNMNTSELVSPSEMLSLATDLAVAYISNNTVAVSEMPAIVDQAFQAITKLCKTGLANPHRPDPAVPANQSIYDDYIICLEDGKQLKMLKRHLRSSYNMTPEQYRERWSLPLDYPMVAPNYSKRRSVLALGFGLGRKSKMKTAA